MDTTKKKGCCRNNKVDVTPSGEYAGVAIDQADGDKVDKKLVKEDTQSLNNNPRNDDDFDM